MKFLSKEINPEGKVFMNVVLVSSLLTLSKYLLIWDIYFVRTNETLTIRLILRSYTCLKLIIKTLDKHPWTLS